MSKHNPYELPTFGNSLLLRVDGAIGAMSLSPSGRDCVLAGRRGLFIIDLDDPFTTPRWLHHITSWEVADVQWSPHHHVKPGWCISTSNQKALLWDLQRTSNNAIINVLHKHTRAITDINFHPTDPEILATCSVDTFIYSWDMRCPRKPVVKWAEWRAGATQVKWNHENPYEIATCHDNSYYIWDSRKSALPTLKVNKAHDGKINGLDFSNGSLNIITCSNDHKVKFWNLKSGKARSFVDNFNYFDSDNDSNVLQPAVVINTDFPVARARPLPFGKEKACGIMPLRGGSNSIHIVNYDQQFQLATSTDTTQQLTAENSYEFTGHDGHMKDFLWRTRHERYQGFELKNNWKDYQLVTWSSEDYDLKLWQFDEKLYKKVNYDPTFVPVFKEELDFEDKSPGPTALKEYDYRTYCSEPPVTIEDFSRRTNGDVLSSLALLQIAEKHKRNTHNINQINHLDWISGVRLGRAGQVPQRKAGQFDGLEDPSNLGEEVSIVGHKFPKLQFEKISVSTGELVISLRGLVDVVAPSPEPKDPSITEPTDNLSNIGNEESDYNSVANGTDTVLTTANANPVQNNKVSTNIPNTGTIPQNTQNIANHTIPATATSNSPGLVPVGAKSEKEVESSTTAPVEDASQEQVLIFIRMKVNFPPTYPYLEEIDPSKVPSKKLAKLQKANLIKFDIEETHELTPAIKEEMLKKLNEIAGFYTNKYNRFCLEPCLRFLMGDKIELDDSLMLERQAETDEHGEPIQEIGTEGWADELINQQPGMKPAGPDHYSSAEEDNDEDFIPAIVDNALMDNSNVDSVTEFAHDAVAKNTKHNEFGVPLSSSFFDSTPLPKGCGATWSATGQLVCFFIPSTDSNDKNVSGNQHSIFKFKDGEFSVNIHQNSSQTHRHELSDFDESESDEDDSDAFSVGSLDNDSMSSSDNESFTQDWDDMIREDAPDRGRIPGLFKTSVGLGHRFVGESSNKNSVNRFSNQGTGSNYRSSIPENSKKKKIRSNRRNKNIVGIFDFSHLLPDKLYLARDYRILGDAPENLARYNSMVALKYGLKEISEAWKILELVLTKDLVQEDDADISKEFDNLVSDSNIGKDVSFHKSHRFYWGNHPFGHSWLIGQIFKYFEQRRNVQMLAMMACILHENYQNVKKHGDDVFDIPIHTPYKALPPPPSLSAMTKFNETNQLVSLSHNFQTQHFKQISDGNRMNMTSRNSSVLIPMKDQHLRSDSYAESVTSSAASLKVGSPDRFSNFKKNIQQSPSNSPFHGGADSPKLFRNKLSTLRHNSIADIRKTAKKRGGKTTGKNKFRPAPYVTIDMQNTEDLDLYEDLYVLQLLDSQNASKLRTYREQYANLLYLWQLPISRIKVLKFNYSDADNSKTSEFDMHRCKITLRNRSRQNPRHPFVNTISSIKTCTSNAWNTPKRNFIKYCNLCQLSVSKNFIVCQTCEHLSHADCAAEWWSDPDNDECPSGCGCKCLNITNVD